MNGQDYLVCVLVSLSCLVFISLIRCILIFISKTDKKNQTVEADLDKDISKLQLEFDRLDKTREQLTNKILLTVDRTKTMMVRRNYICTNKYIPQLPKKDQKYFGQDLDTWYTELKFKK